MCCSLEPHLIEAPCPDYVGLPPDQRFDLGQSVKPAAGRNGDAPENRQVLSAARRTNGWWGDFRLWAWPPFGLI
jgi:hypothetical protein